MGHQLDSDPAVWLHGVVPRVRTLGRDGVGDVVQHGRGVLPAVAVRAHQSHVALEVGFPIILLEVRGSLAPQLVGRAGHEVSGRDAGGRREVPRLDDGHFDPPGLHLVAEAIGKSFHAVFRHAERRLQGGAHPPRDAGQVHHTSCRDGGYGAVEGFCTVAEDTSAAD